LAGNMATRDTSVETMERIKLLLEFKLDQDWIIPMNSVIKARGGATKY